MVQKAMYTKGYNDNRMNILIRDGSIFVIVVEITERCELIRKIIATQRIFLMKHADNQLLKRYDGCI